MEEGSLPSPAPPRRVAFSDKHSFHRIPHTAAAPTVSGTSNLFTHHEGIVDSSKSDEENHLWTPAPELENYYSNNKKSKTVPCHPMMQQTSSSFSHKRKFEESSGKKKEPERTRGTWTSAWGSLQNTLKESIQNSWHLGFLWPDDDDDDDGLEYLLQEESCCEHDHDHDYDHHYHDLETAAKHQQQGQKHEDWVETDSLLQPNSGKLRFSPPGYGTWHSNPHQTFSNGELKDGSLQNHSNNNKGHKTSGLSNAIHPQTKITHAKSAPEFIMGSDTSVMLQEDKEDITTPANSVSHGDTEIHKTTAAESRNISLKPSKSMPADLHPHPAVVKKSFHRCNTAPAMSAEAAEAVVNRNSSSSSTAVKPPRKLEKSGSIVMQAGIGLMIYLAVGVMIYTWKRQEFSGLQTVSYVDALYFCIVTMCTIGYGDITPITTSSKLFACLFVLIGFGFIDILLSSMVSYVLDKQEHLLLSAVEGSHYQTARKYFMNPHHHNRVRIRLKVALAAGVPVLCITVGTIVMMQMEQLSWIDALYCTTMSITTVGYGDHTFKSFKGRLFAAVWLLFSTLAVARCFLYLAEARVDKRHRAIAKWVLRRQFSVGDLIKADLDHDGSISKAEYVVYKLKEMGHVEDEHIHDICLQFDQLDCNKTGKITLARLQDGLGTEAFATWNSKVTPEIEPILMVILERRKALMHVASFAWQEVCVAFHACHVESPIAFIAWQALKNKKYSECREYMEFKVLLDIMFVEVYLKVHYAPELEPTMGSIKAWKVVEAKRVTIRRLFLENTIGLQMIPRTLDCR